MNAPAVVEQPAPTKSSSPEVWPTVYENVNLGLPEWLAADMKLRHELGRMKYGEPLRVDNGRDAVLDAYQEALDLIVYAQQARMRLGAPSLGRTKASEWNTRLALDLVFHTALQAARYLGDLVHADPKGVNR